MVLIILSLTATLAIFRQVEREPHAQQMAQLVVSVINLTRAAVLSAAPEWRSALLAELADVERLGVQMADKSDVLKPLPAHPLELHLMMKKVRENLGKNTRFAAEHNGVEALWVSFFIGNEEFWVALPKEHIENPVSQVLLIWGSLVFGLALLGAYFIARQVAFPYSNLRRRHKK